MKDIEIPQIFDIPIAFSPRADSLITFGVQNSMTDENSQYTACFPGHLDKMIDVDQNHPS